MRKDLMLIAIVVATLTLMVVPLSQGIIDVLLATNMALSVLLLMVALYLRNPSDFSTFPSVILIGTAFRLALSIGTTRLILSEADAGQIIETFGEFVVAGSIAIGLVIFLIITVVQFLVVTKGAERVAEVGARFALDAMPGKQMSIDAELRSGNIDADEASARRRRLDRDSQFFGAMDGAMKFVKGDAIAGLVIICINLLGGVAVGMTTHGMGFGEAVGVFSLLTVGDGLVAQIPALLMSLCAGVIVTRVANLDNDDLGTDIFKELVSDPRVPGIAAVVVLAMGFIPGFPTAIFVVMSMILLASAMLLRASLHRDALDAAMQAPDAADAEPAPDADTASGRVRLVLGSAAAEDVDLAELDRRIVDKFERLHAARGVRFPRTGIDVADRHGADAVAVEIDEVPVFRGTIPTDTIAVRGDGTLAEIIGGEGADGPVEALDWLDLQGAWLPLDRVEEVEPLGYETLPIEGAVAHLAYRVYERSLGTLFSNAVFAELLALMHGAEPEAMQEIDDKITRPALHRLLRYLVEDGVPVRPLPLLIGSLHHWLHSLDAPNVVGLAEHLRGSMKRQLCYRIAGERGVLGVILLDPALEATIRRSLQESRRTPSLPAEDGLTLAPRVNEAILEQLRGVVASRGDGTRLPAIVCGADLRRRLRNYLATHDVHIPVLASHELAGEITTYPLDLLRAPSSDAAKRASSEARPAVGRRREDRGRAVEPAE